MPHIKLMMNMQTSYIELFKLISLPATFMTSQMRSGICFLLYRTHSLTTHSHYCQSEIQAVLTFKYLKENFIFCSNWLQIHSLLEKKRSCFSFYGLFQSDVLTIIVFSRVNLLKLGIPSVGILTCLSAYHLDRFLYFSS